jgi:electron transport complex protein RnfA
MAGLSTWLTWVFILKPFGLEFLRTLVFILVIATLVQFVEMFLKKNMPTLYTALGIYLPLITTNCAVLGVCFINIDEDYSLVKTLVSSLAYPAGFGLALILFAGVRERILLARVPKPLQDTSIGLLTAGMFSLAFFGFKGMA